MKLFLSSILSTHLNLSLCLFMCLPNVCLFVCLSNVCLLVCLSNVCLFVWLSNICLSNVCLFICLSIMYPYTGCLKKNCAVGVLVTEETIFVQFLWSRCHRKLYISVISWCEIFLSRPHTFFCYNQLFKHICICICLNK